jgi:hypothetical protein
MLARAIWGFILGAILGGGMALYSLPGQIDSVLYASAACGFISALASAISPRLLRLLEKLISFFSR